MTISRYAIILIVLLLETSAGIAPRSWPSSCEPVPMQAAAQTANPRLPKSSSAEESPSYVIEHYATTIHFQNDGTSRRELRVRARVLSDAGAQHLSHLAFEYDRQTEKLDISDIEIHHATGGTIGVLAHAVMDRPIAAVNDAAAYEDAREKSVRIPALKPSDILQYTVTLAVTKPAAPGNFWLEHNFLREGPANEELLEIAVPRDRPIKLKTRRGLESFTTADEQDGATLLRVYRWKLTRGAHPVMPGPVDEPDIQISTFISWEDLGRWLQQQWKESSNRDTALEAKVADITRGHSTSSEKLAALYTFVAKEIRTIELAPNAVGFRSLPGARVLAQGYGTSVDKHALLAAMAKAIGLPSIAVLLNSSREITDSVPSPAQFSHLVTAVKTGEGWTWLDTAPEVAPYRFLPANLRNKRGLALREPDDDAGQSKARVEWITTPADPPFPATQRVAVDGVLSSDGKLTARVLYAVRGDAELLLRVAFHRAPPGQWKNLGQLLAISDGFRGDVTNVIASNPEETEKPFEIEYKIAQNKVVVWKNQNAVLPLPLPSFGMPELPAATAAGMATDSPLELGTPLSVTVVATISVPRGVVIKRSPFAVGVKRDYAEYRSVYNAEGNKVTATRELRFLLRTLPPDRIADYAAFSQAVRNDEAQQVTLERSAPPTPPAKTDKIRAKNAYLRAAHTR